MLDWSSWSPEAVVGVTLVSLLLIIVLVVVAMCIHAGILHPINIKTKQPEFGEMVVMYKSGRGAYSESGAMFTEAHTLLPEYNCIGVYYDDPEKKSSEKLRYIVGLVVAEGEDNTENADHVTLMESNGYKRTVFPAVKHAVVTEFPYTSTLSCIFAVFRVYPALREYVEKRELCAHPILEVYDSTNCRIVFMGPLEQQDNFYVEDVLEDNAASSLDDCDDDDDSDDSSSSSQQHHDRDHDDDEEDEREGSAASQQDTNTWEKSASLVAAPPAGSSAAAAEESDTNTCSSFEEIDANDAALPTVDDDDKAGDACHSAADNNTVKTDDIPPAATPVSDPIPILAEPAVAQQAPEQETAALPEQSVTPPVEGIEGGNTGEVSESVKQECIVSADVAVDEAAQSPQ